MPTQAYSVYGYTCALWTTLGFSGELLSVEVSKYFLGNGYRALDPVLMRFLSADNASPFGAGGINCYAYCSNDPINQVDPDGHMPRPVPGRSVNSSPAPSSVTSRRAHSARSSSVSGAARFSTTPPPKIIKPSVDAARVGAYNELSSTAANAEPVGTPVDAQQSHQAQLQFLMRLAAEKRDLIDPQNTPLMYALLAEKNWRSLVKQSRLADVKVIRKGKEWF